MAAAENRGADSVSTAVRTEKMNRICMLVFFVSFILAPSFVFAQKLQDNSRESLTSNLAGSTLHDFISQFAVLTISLTEEGKCVDLTIKNSSHPTRLFFSVQLVLLRGNHGTIDVFEWTSGVDTYKDIQVLFNVSNAEFGDSYLVFREPLSQLPGKTKIKYRVANVLLRDLEKEANSTKKP